MASLPDYLIDNMVFCLTSSEITQFYMAFSCHDHKIQSCHELDEYILYSERDAWLIVKRLLLRAKHLSKEKLCYG